MNLIHEPPASKAAKNIQGRVIWITGLSGAGKSTLGKEITEHLRREGEAVVLLDGDELREIWGVAGNSNHSQEKRLVLAKQYALLCQLLSKQGLTVVICTISLFHEVHEWNRTHLPGYFEVYLKVPLEELYRRDAKGIYGQFKLGELSNVVGLDVPFDEPKAADWVIDFSRAQSVSKTADELMKKIKEFKNER